MASVASARNRHNVLLRYRSADDPIVVDARRELRVAKLADYIKRTVAEAPPLTSEQRDRLAALLRPARSSSAAPPGRRTGPQGTADPLSAVSTERRAEPALKSGDAA